MTRWKYCSPLIPLPQLADGLNKLGADGWELVAQVPINIQSSPLAGAQQGLGVLCTFKREVALEGHD